MRMRWTLAVFLVVGLLGGASVVAQKAADSRVRNRLTAMPGSGGQSWSPPAQTPPPTLPTLGDMPSPLPQVQGESDPIEAVDVFVQRNVKVADDSIKALTQEAEALKARLAKVEAALARWQAVNLALQNAPQPGVKATNESPPLSIPGPTAAGNLPAETSTPPATRQDFLPPPGEKTAPPPTSPDPFTPPPGDASPPLPPSSPDPGTIPPPAPRT